MQTKAIVLKKQPTKEYDQLVTCYSQELGKITAVAKSSLKQNSIQGRHLDLFNLVEFDLINGHATPIITGAQCERSFRHIKSSLPLTAAASFFAEVIERTAYDHQHDEHLWQFLTDTLDQLDALDGHELASWFPVRQKEFLRVLGHPDTMPVAAVSHQPLTVNDVFEYTFGRQFTSLKFLQQVV